MLLCAVHMACWLSGRKDTSFECSMEAKSLLEIVFLCTAESSQIGSISVCASERCRKVCAACRAAIARTLCYVI